MSAQTRRDYAVSLGLAEHKRGRMSQAAWDAIKEAEAGGTKFADSDQPYPAPPKPRQAGVRKEHRPLPPASPKPVVQTTEQKAPVIAAKAFTGKFEVQIPGGARKALSGRTACTCGASLAFCWCKTPTVYQTIVDPGADDVDSVLNIERV
jgi:hypothetical protein